MGSIIQEFRLLEKIGNDLFRSLRQSSKDVAKPSETRKNPRKSCEIFEKCLKLLRKFLENFK